jgi:hypothetical protein
LANFGLRTLGNLCTGGPGSVLSREVVGVVGIEGSALALVGRSVVSLLRAADHRTHLACGGSRLWRTA